MMKQKPEGQVAFTEKESEFLSESKLGRVATVSRSLQPHVVPIVYEFDGQFIYFGGYNLTQSLKFRNMEQNNKVAFVVDDLASEKPWRPRGIEIRGVVQVLFGNGETYSKKAAPEGGEPAGKLPAAQPYVKIIPRTKKSWGFKQE